MAATARIAAEHGSFNRIRRMAPMYPCNTWFLRAASASLRRTASRPVRPFLQSPTAWQAHRPTDRQTYNTTSRHSYRNSPHLVALRAVLAMRAKSKERYIRLSVPVSPEQPTDWLSSVRWLCEAGMTSYTYQHHQRPKLRQHHAV